MSANTAKKGVPLQHNTGSTPGRGEKAEKRVYEVYRQGFLLRAHGGVRKTLKRYWFVLFEQKDLLAFLYFADEDHYLEKKKNEGFFRIDDATSIDVLPMYMGRKNAFCITTPRNKYYLVSESRYELHNWLFALHNAMEEYKQHNQARKKRQRSSSTSGANPVATGGTSPTTIGKTPPRIKPSRPAPPVPQGKKKENESPNTNTLTRDEHTHQVSPLHEVLSPTTSPLDAIVAGLLAESNEMVGVEYNLNEEEEAEHGDETTPIHDHHQPVDATELNLESSRNGTTSTSLPVLTDVGKGGSKEGTESPENFSGPSSQDNDQFVSSYDGGNGRYTMPMDNRSSSHQQKKISRKRSSTKGMRSVSPPNLPPPPPPDSTTTDGGQKEEIKNGKEDKYEEVMSSLTDFGDALKEMKSEMQLKLAGGDLLHPKPLPPVRTSSLAVKGDSKEDPNSSVQSYLDEAFKEEDNRDCLSEEEEHVTMETKTKPEGVSPGILRKEGGVGGGGGGGKRNVAFQDGKRNGPSYEPRIDREDRPLSVLEAKKKLFGDAETKVALYRRSYTQEEEKKEDDKAGLSPDDSVADHADDLLRSIENALESTSYMEERPHNDKRRTPPPVPGQAEQRKSFTVMVGEEERSPIPPPSLPPPVRHTSSLEEEKNKDTATEPQSLNGIAETSGSTEQNPVYRSLV